MTVYEGPDGVARYVAITLKHGLLFYAKTGMKPNRAWTPTAMLAKAREITGRQDLPARDYIGAATALQEYLNNGETHGEEPFR